MTFEERKGNLFDYMNMHAAYAHCIANDNNYGAGIAPIFVNKVFKQKSLLTQNLKEHPWEMTKTGWACIIAEENKPFAVHLVTKKHTAGKPNYTTIRDALTDMKTKLARLPGWNKQICMPKIACGLDKLSWPTVRKIIEGVFKDTDYNITVYYL